MAITCLAPAIAAASSPSVLQAQHPHWLGFRGDLGAEVPFGSAGELFQGNVRGEFSLLFQPRPITPLYVGFGASWTTFHVEPQPPLTDEDGGEKELVVDPWNYVGAQVLLGVSFDKWINAPLYAEARLIERRLRPMDDRFWEIDPHNRRKERPFPQQTGWGFEGAVGLTLPKGCTTTCVDLSARAGQFAPDQVVFTDMLDIVAEVEDADLIEVFEVLPDVTGGWMLGIQVGLLWFP